MGFGFRAGKEGRARPEPQERVDDAEDCEDGKDVFRAQDAAGVERDEHDRAQREAARQGVRQSEALEYEGDPESARADREVLRGWSGQGIGARRADNQGYAERPRDAERSRADLPMA